MRSKLSSMVLLAGWRSLHSVRQKNEANGKLRPNAVPPRHDRIVQLGARDGSDEKYEAKAKREREDAHAILSGKQQESVSGIEPQDQNQGGRRASKRVRGTR
jgi:hypothetical protein